MSFRSKLKGTIKSISLSASQAIERIRNQGIPRQSEAIYSPSQEAMSQPAKLSRLLGAAKFTTSLAVVGVMAVGSLSYASDQHKETSLNSPFVVGQNTQAENNSFTNQVSQLIKVTLNSKEFIDDILFGDEPEIDEVELDYQHGHKPDTININDLYDQTNSETTAAPSLGQFYDLALMTVSNAYRDKIKEEEGLRTRAYLDSGGVWTIGYGHTGKVDGKPISANTVISIEKANALFEADLAVAEESLKELISEGIVITQGQFNTLVDFVFNKGPENLKKSTLLALVNSGDVNAAGREFHKWVNVRMRDSDGNPILKNGRPVYQKVEGLVNRAERNQASYLSSIPKPVLDQLTTLKFQEDLVNKTLNKLDRDSKRHRITSNIESPRFIQDIDKSEQITQGFLKEIEKHKENVTLSINAITDIKDSINASVDIEHLTENGASNLLEKASLIAFLDNHLNTQHQHLEKIEVESWLVMAQLDLLTEAKEVAMNYQSGMGASNSISSTIDYIESQSPVYRLISDGSLDLFRANFDRINVEHRSSNQLPSAQTY